MRWGLAIAVVAAFGVACLPASSQPRSIAQVPRLPPPVQVRQTPEVALADPAFEPLPGARAEYGRLGGAVYQIEIPARWNGRLVLWMHGFEDYRSTARATAPDFRRHLIAGGYAWAASSFSTTAFIPDRAADETAALWDHFVREHGRPRRTYVSGLSMGGWATHLAAERYANRFDGAVAFCGGVEPSTSPDVLVAAAYVAGVSQAEFDAAPSVATLVDRRIRPALRRSRTHARFEQILVALTGGPRAYARAGIHLEEETNLRQGAALAANGLAPPRREPYRLGRGSPVTSAEFNRAALRFPVNAKAQRALWAGVEVRGRPRMPLLTVHATGDGLVPIAQARILRARVAAAGMGRRLVQRVIRDANHCGFRTAEQEASFDALARWVERGRRPAGTNLDDADLRALDRTFELGPPRQAGRRDRVVVRGRATLDGKPFDARWIGAVVRNGALVTPCQASLPSIDGGRFRIAVLRESAALGCGGAGSEILFWTFVDDEKLFATGAVRWPRSGSRRAAIAFSTADPLGASPPVTEFAGEVYRSAGERVAPGTSVEAWVGDALCGRASVGSSGFYILAVVGPDSVPGCTAGGQIAFRVGGLPAREVAINSPDQSAHLDLSLS